MYRYTRDNRFSALHEPNSENWILELRDTKMTDEGIYECQISTTPVRSRELYLKVVDKKTGGKALEGCLNPKGWEGESVSEGCIKQTCKKGIWRTALDSTVCCYEGESYAIGSSLPTVLSDDGCGAVDHQCVLDDGQAVLQLHVENRCSGYATQDQARELKSLVEEYLSKKC